MQRNIRSQGLCLDTDRSVILKYGINICQPSAPSEEWDIRTLSNLSFGLSTGLKLKYFHFCLSPWHKNKIPPSHLLPIPWNKDTDQDKKFLKVFSFSEIGVPLAKTVNPQSPCPHLQQMQQQVW